MSVRGQEFPAYDARGIQGMGLAYATSNRGACHLRGYTVASEVLGHPGQDRSAGDRRQGRAGQGLPGCDGGRRLAGICIFTTFAWTLADVQPQLPGRLRRRLVDGQAQRLVGERIWNMERQFNLAAGLTAKDDDLPPRLKTEPARPVRLRAWSTARQDDAEYYKVRGWTPDGVPEQETLGAGWTVGVDEATDARPRGLAAAPSPFASNGHETRHSATARLASSLPETCRAAP